MREPVMRELRASIRERQMRGVSAEKLRDWIDRREAVGEISEVLAAWKAHRAIASFEVSGPGMTSTSRFFAG